MTPHPWRCDTRDVPRRLATLALALALPALTGLAGCSGSSGGQPAAAVDYASLHGAVPDAHDAKPAFTLTDTAGQPYDFAARTAGSTTLLYFGYTNCKSECPTTMADIASALRRTAPDVRSQVTVVFVTTDPRRDTPAALRQWLDRFDTSFIGLRGSVRQIQQAEQEVGVPLARQESNPKGRKGGGYSVAHFSAALAYGRDNQLATLYPTGVTPGDIAADLPVLVKG